MDLQEFEQKFRDLFGRGVEEVRDGMEDAKAQILSLENGLATLRGVAEEYAALGLAAAQRELARLQAEAPAAAALIEDAEKAVARWQALVAKLEGAPSGM